MKEILAQDSDRICVVDPTKQKDILSYLPKVICVVCLAGLTLWALFGRVLKEGTPLGNLLDNVDTWTSSVENQVKIFLSLLSVVTVYAVVFFIKKIKG